MKKLDFVETLTKGLDILSQEIPNIKDNTLDGQSGIQVI